MIVGGSERSPEERGAGSGERIERWLRAESALGPKFYIKPFGNLLISAGSQPLPVLERRVDEWIAGRVREQCVEAEACRAPAMPGPRRR